MSTANGNGAGSAILARLDALEKKLDRLMAHLGATRAASGNGAPATVGGRVGTPQDITGDRGDPKVRMVPKAWTGENFKGVCASQCSPDFLDIYADQLDWFADHPKADADPKKADWDRLDAARCRRWALEIREGRREPGARKTHAPTPPPDDAGTVWSGGGHAHDGGLPPPPSDDGMPPPPFGDDDTPF